MNSKVSEAEAQFALSSIEHRRQQVIAEIDVPSWYWIGLAGGWIVLGVLAQYGPAWASIAGTVAFGAVHAAVAPRVLTGRHASTQVSVRGDLVSHGRDGWTCTDRTCGRRSPCRTPGECGGGGPCSRRRTEADGHGASAC
jgi:hypothetical protein